jgi:Flp pilus assembly protein TadG
LRLWRDERGQAVIAEFTIMFLLLLGFLGGFTTYALALHARAAVIQATDAGGRLLGIDCNPENPNYPNAVADAEALTVQTMSDAGLDPKSQPATIGLAGSYTIAAACEPSTGEATLTLTYEQVDVFPVLGHRLLSGPDNAAGTFQIESGAVFPIE